MTSVLLLLLLLLVVLQLSLPPACRANPENWVYNISPNDCFAHPMRGYLRHGAPVNDTLSSYIVADTTTGANSVTVCPGVSYNVTFTWPNPSYALMTLNLGVIQDRAEVDQNVTCSNRDITSEDNTQATSWTRTVTVDCTASGNFVIQVTRAEGEVETYQHSSVTMLVDPSCADSTCPPSPPGGYLPKPSPPPPDAPPPATNSLLCDPSTLGYDCSKVYGDVTLHWTVNSTAPVNSCTGTAEAANALAPDLGVLHMAAQSTTTGWVGVAFSQDSAYMFPADSVIGWITSAGSPTVASWHFTDYYGTQNSRLAGALNPTWAKAMGVSQSQAGVTTICFSRYWSDPNSIIYPVLPDVLDMKMAWAAAENGQTNYEQHTRDGGISLNLGTGAGTATASASRANSINIHGILMCVAWILLMPLGALMPRHRWLMSDAKVMGIHLWFRIHQMIQLSGMSLFIAGFVYAYYEFPDPILGGVVGEAHQIMGIIVMAMASLQVVAAFVRPEPTAPLRKYWTMLHQYLGRLCLVTAWATVYLGIYIYHNDASYKAGYNKWLAPVIAVNVSIVLLDVGLTIFRHYMVKEDMTDADAYKQEEGKSGGDDFTSALEMQQQEVNNTLEGQSSGLLGQHTTRRSGRLSNGPRLSIGHRLSTGGRQSVGSP